MTEFLLIVAGALLAIPIALLLLFALTRPPRETVRTEYVYRVNGEIVDEADLLARASLRLSDEDEAALARASEKAKAIFHQRR